MAYVRSLKVLVYWYKVQKPVLIGLKGIKYYGLEQKAFLASFLAGLLMICEVVRFYFNLPSLLLFQLKVS